MYLKLLGRRNRARGGGGVYSGVPRDDQAGKKTFLPRMGDRRRGRGTVWGKGEKRGGEGRAEQRFGFAV